MHFTNYKRLKKTDNWRIVIVNFVNGTIKQVSIELSDKNIV